MNPRRKNAGGASGRTLERRERFDVVSVGEEVEEVQRAEAPARRGQPARVAGEGYGIAGEEANLFVRLSRNRFDDIALCSRSGRIEKDEIGARHVLDPPLDGRVDQLDVSV